MLEIHIPVVNNPIFIELQYLSLKKFCQDDFKIVIFNDAKDWPDYSNFNDISIKHKIKDICDKLGITHHFLPNNHHKNQDFIHASQRHCDTANYIFQNFQKDNPNPILILDSDMFPIQPFSFERWIKNDVAGILQERDNCTYLWPNLFFMKPNILNETFDWGLLINEKIRTDTGGRTSLYLEKNNLDIYKINHLISLRWNKKDKELDEDILYFLENDIRNEKGMYFCEIYDDVFLHLRAGSNWEGIGQNIHFYRTLSLKKMLEKLCN